MDRQLAFTSSDDPILDDRFLKKERLPHFPVLQSHEMRL